MGNKCVYKYEIFVPKIGKDMFQGFVLDISHGWLQIHQFWSWENLSTNYKFTQVTCTGLIRE